MTFWVNGSTTETTPTVEITDRGLLLGDAVFDTALAFSGRVVFGERHQERLANWLTSLGMDFAPAQLAAPYEALSQADAPTSVRVTVTRGSGPRGVSPPRLANPRIFGMSAPLPPCFVSAPTKLRTAKARRNSSSVSANIKTTNYADAVNEVRIAVDAGLDDALFFNERGRVVSSSIANVLVAKGSSLFTPPISDGALPGIIRGLLVEKLGAQEKSLTLDDVLNSDGVMLTNSLRLVSPVLGLDESRFEQSRWFVRVQDFLLNAVRDDCGLDLTSSACLYRTS